MMRVDVGKYLHSSTRSTRFLAKNGVFLRVNHAKNAPKSADFSLFRAVSVPLQPSSNMRVIGTGPVDPLVQRIAMVK